MKFQSNSIFNGTIIANSVADAGTNTDKFLVLNSSGVVTYRTAAELYADLGVGSSSAAYTAALKHPVKAGEAINKGQAVYVSSADGTNMIVSKASNATEATSSKTIGLLETTLAINGIGNVITEGLLAGLDTTGATNAGDPVWLGTGGNLIYGLINKPYAPANLVFIGIVTRINANNGEIFVKVQNGFELQEIHDVDLITTTPVNGHILGYNGTLWVNKTIAGWLGFTPVTNARTLTINGTAYDLSADRSWTISSMIYPGAGIAVSTGTAWGTSITNNSANWDTAYTNRITSLTVTGSSGAATLVSNVLNIPTYTLTGLGGVPTTRSLTINGTAYDLSADRSWTIDSTSASTRTIQKFTATSGQTTFTITGGYAVGMVDVYMNGVKLDNATDFTASNGTTVVLAAGALTNSVIEVYKFGSQFIPNNALRVVTSFTATAAQTTFTVNYSVGLVDVFYNGSNLAQSEYTATNGTSIILATACQVNDIVVVYAYSYSVGAYSGIGGSGTTNYHPKFSSSSSITTSGIYEGSAGFISIGNTNTTYNLDVTGTGRFTGDLTANGVTIGASDIRSSSNVLTLGGTTEIIRITSAGNVGIGTSSPNRILEVATGGDTYLRVTGNRGNADDLHIGNVEFYNSNTTRIIAEVRAITGTGGTQSNSGQLAFYTNNAGTYAERMRITSGGNVGIGTSSPDWPLTVKTDASANSIKIIGRTGGDNALAFYGSDASTLYGHIDVGASYFQIYTSNSQPMQFFTGGSERMRITSGGSVCINSTRATAALVIDSNLNALTGIDMRDTGTTGGAYIFFQNSAGNQSGIITHSGTTSITYTSTSDYRLKENVKTIENGLDRVLNLKPVTYTWIDTDNEQGEGFLAHELQEIVPLAVVGQKDELKEDGSIKAQSIDNSRIVPILVKAMQEQQAMITSLQEQIIELKQIVATK